MGGYLINFIVYTAAMVGIIFLAVFVYKKCSFGTTSKSKFLNVEDCISIAPRKELFVVRAGNEKFLIASDVGRTTLISKLENQSSPIGVENINEASVLHNSKQCSVDELPKIVNTKKNMRKRQTTVFENIINNI